MRRRDMMRRHRLIAALLLAQGCMFRIDARIVEPGVDAGDTGDDAAAEDRGETPFDEAKEPWDAGEPDACPPEGCPPPCGEDSECSADHYCSRATGACATRCDESLGCAAERAPGVQSMLADGQTLYWSTRGDPTVRLDEPRASIWSWDLEGAPVTVYSGLIDPTLRFVADGFLYYTERATGPFLQWPFVRWDVRRVSLSSPASPEAVADSVSSVWKTEAAIYWSTMSGVPTAELWRMPRQGAGDARRLSVGQHAGWYGGNEAFAIHLEQQNARFAVFADQLGDSTVTRQIVGSEPGLSPIDELIVVGSMLYFNVPADGVIYGVDSAAPGRPGALTPTRAASADFFEHAGWLYWSAATEWSPNIWEIVYGGTRWGTPPAPLQLRRTVRSGSVPANDMQFSLVAQQVVYWNEAEERFFRFTLPPLPCSDISPCPSGQTCTPAMLCQ